MHRGTSNHSARKVVAALWGGSMLFSGLIGVLLLGFDASTVLKWCVLAALPPVLVLAFVRRTTAPPPDESRPRPGATRPRSRPSVPHAEGSA
ncbi:MAG: hypothetical protein M3Y34_04485 [Actinomycetota bacterium]|nr:hypothetical protein [Actinomycetota bacterium]